MQWGGGEEDSLGLKWSLLPPNTLELALVAEGRSPRSAENGQSSLLPTGLSSDSSEAALSVALKSDKPGLRKM